MALRPFEINNILLYHTVLVDEETWSIEAKENIEDEGGQFEYEEQRCV